MNAKKKPGWRAGLEVEIDQRRRSSTMSIIQHPIDASKLTLHSDRDDAWDANTRVAVRLAAALKDAGRGPKWVGKQLGISKGRAKFLVNGETAIFISDLVILGRALEMSAADFFDGVDLHASDQSASSLSDDGEDG